MFINEFVDFLTSDDVCYINSLISEFDSVYNRELIVFKETQESRQPYKVRFIDKDVRNKLNMFISDLDLTASYKGFKFQDVWNPYKESKHLYNGSRIDTKERLYYAFKYQLLINAVMINNISDSNIRYCIIQCIFLKLFVEVNNSMTYNINNI